MASKEDAKFRGNWSPSVGNSYGFKFLPTAPAQKPKPKHAPPPEPEIIDTTPVLTDAPSEANASGALNIRDRYNNYRGYVSAGGICYNNRDQIIGYIDAASGQVDTRDEEYLGYIRQDNVIENAVNEKLGEVDLGRAIIKNERGTTVAEFDNTGSVSGHVGTYLGQFEGFTYRELKIVALYLLLVDPGMLNEVEG